MQQYHSSLHQRDYSSAKYHHFLLFIFLKQNNLSTLFFIVHVTCFRSSWKTDFPDPEKCSSFAISLDFFFFYSLRTRWKHVLNKSHLCVFMLIPSCVVWLAEFHRTQCQWSSHAHFLHPSPCATPSNFLRWVLIDSTSQMSTFSW